MTNPADVHTYYSLPHPFLLSMKQSATTNSPAPLDGLRVLEFSHTIMGPCAGLLLADMGADVIKIEPAPNGDKTRYLTGFAAGFFATFNRNKRSLAVDLKSPEGQELVHKLVQTADVVLDNYGPGTMERLNCGWLTLKALNDRLVYLSLKGFLAGPWQQRPALDEVVQFQSGLAYMTGPPGQPLRAGASIIDILGALFGVTGTLAALRERDITQQGQRVDSALFESAAFLMASHLAGGAATGEEIPPMTVRRGAWGIYDVFYSKEGIPLFIGVTSEPQWIRFCEVFQFKKLLLDARLTTNKQRTQERDWLIPKLEKYCRGIAYEVLLSGCQRAEVSCSPVAQPEDLWKSEQLLANGGLLDIALATAQHSVADNMAIPGLPLSFGDSQQRLALTRQPPMVGEHTKEILQQIGLSSDNIGSLIESGIVQLH